MHERRKGGLLECTPRQRSLSPYLGGGGTDKLLLKGGGSDSQPGKGLESRRGNKDSLIFSGGGKILRKKRAGPFSTSSGGKKGPSFA